MYEESDEQLVALYLEGDESALTNLVQKYITPLYNFAGQFVGYGAAAEDVVQETFIKVWKHIKRFDRSKKFKPWLYRIARNTAIDYIRQHKITVSLEDVDLENGASEYIVDLQPLPAERLVSLEATQAIQAVVSKLPPIYGTVMRLYYIEDFSLPEIADILSESVDTVKSRHRRALIRIRQLLAADTTLLP